MEAFTFPSRDAFARWLSENGGQPGGVWLLFGKRGGPQTLTAAEALEEALCHGWIDGQMKSLDDTCYQKYFAPRRPGSNWSEKNKALAEKLAAEGKMTARGLAQVELAKSDGRWHAPKRPDITPGDIAQVEEALAPYPQALANFRAMSPSVQKSYTGGYLSTKTPAGRESRLKWMVDRLEKGLKPM